MDLVQHFLLLTYQDLSLHECADLWDRRSDLFAAGWLGLPKSDSDLWNELAPEFTTDSKKDTERDPFETIVRPVMKYLADHHHPHVTIVITSTNAQLVEGIKSTGEIMDYIKD